jgi:hypothetical protein
MCAWCLYIKPGQLNLFNGTFLTGNRNLPLPLSEPSVNTPVKLLKQKQRCIYALSSCVMKTRSTITIQVQPVLVICDLPLDKSNLTGVRFTTCGLSEKQR